MKKHQSGCTEGALIGRNDRVMKVQDPFSPSVLIGWIRSGTMIEAKAAATPRVRHSSKLADR